MSASWKVLNNTIRHLHRKACLANSSGAGDRDQPHILSEQQLLDIQFFVLSSDEPSPLNRQICRSYFKRLLWPFHHVVAYGCKFTRQVPGDLIAAIGLFSQAALDCPAKWSGDIRVTHTDRCGLFPDDPHQNLHRCSSLKSAFSGHHLVEEQAERELV